MWNGGSLQAHDGKILVPNMLTKEVFTAPPRERIDGAIGASMPVSSGDTVVDDFELRFEGGRVVQAHAGRGQQELKRILDTDEGARSLGEVALVPASSPIAKSGLHYFVTLDDEDAASHIVLERAFPFLVGGGAEMSKAGAAAAGGPRGR